MRRKTETATPETTEVEVIPPSCTVQDGETIYELVLDESHVIELAHGYISEELKGIFAACLDPWPREQTAFRSANAAKAARKKAKRADQVGGVAHP